MGFDSVFHSLLEIFPQIDARLLKDVAVEHSMDADVAVEVVLSEVLPCVSENLASAVSENYGYRDPTVVGVEPEESVRIVEEANNECGTLLGPVASEDACITDNTVYDDATCMDETMNHCLVSDFCCTIDHHEKVCGSKGSEDLVSMSNGFMQEDCVASDCVHLCEDKESDEMNLLVRCQRINPEVGPKQNLQVLSETSICERVDVPPSENVLLSNWEKITGPVSCELDTVIQGNSHPAELCFDSTHVVAENSMFQHLEQEPNFLDAKFDFGTPATDCEKSEASGYVFNCKHNCIDSEMAAIEHESTLNTEASRSGQICRTDFLDGIIDDAKSNKKTLFSSMESVINKMRDVEINETAAEQAQEEAASGGSDILTKVEELKQMLVHAKEANDVLAGEVYGEKAILATEVKELQSRLLYLSDERDKSLAILAEMHQTLVARQRAAEEVTRAAILEKQEKEKFARYALGEQEAIMKKVVQESKILQQEVEENSKIQRFLMDRGRIVDKLQGEISVICQDVRLLKEKFDKSVPLSKSISISQTTCILASSSSSLKCMVSNLVTEPCLSKTQKKASPVPSIDGQSPGVRVTEERVRTVHKALLDDGWDLLDINAEFI